MPHTARQRDNPFLFTTDEVSGAYGITPKTLRDGIDETAGQWEASDYQHMVLWDGRVLITKQSVLHKVLTFLRHPEIVAQEQAHAAAQAKEDEIQRAMAIEAEARRKQYEEDRRLETAGISSPPHIT